MTNVKKILSGFKAWRRDEQQNQVIKTLWTVIGVLVIMNIYMYNGWKSVPLVQTCHYPPDLSKGGEVQNGYVPDSEVYSFGFHIFAAINTWPNQGEKDYKEMITNNSHYISGNFHDYLMQEKIRKEKLGELNRKRFTFDANDVMDLDNVQKISSDVWHVKYRLHIQESVGNQIFKEWIEVYSMVIKKVNTSAEYNTFGLMLVGFYKEPYIEEKII